MFIAKIIQVKKQLDLCHFYVAKNFFLKPFLKEGETEDSMEINSSRKAWIEKKAIRRRSKSNWKIKLNRKIPRKLFFYCNKVFRKNVLTNIYSWFLRNTRFFVRKIIFLCIWAVQMGVFALIRTFKAFSFSQAMQYWDFCPSVNRFLWFY